MRPLPRLAAGLLSCAVAGACLAQTAAVATVPPPPRLSALGPAAAPAPQPAVVAARAPAALPPGRAALLRVQVIEDDNVRIEESRVRGLPQRITVQSKVGVTRPYEITVPAGGKDWSQDRGAAGQRTWSLFDF